MKINDSQARAIGEIIQKEGLCHAQVGKYGDGWVYVFTSKRQNGPHNEFYIDTEGNWANNPLGIRAVK
jgi:hypothetical protein